MAKKDKEIEHSIFDQLQDKSEPDEKTEDGKYKILLMPYKRSGGQTIITLNVIPRIDEHIIVPRIASKVEYKVMLVVHNACDASYDVAIQVVDVGTV